jgi:hypothetical protein
MAILSGRNGVVAYDSVPASPFNPITVISINSWKLSLKTDYEEVSCFGDTNKVYIPGLRDISGTFGGFWNSAELTIVHATNATTPGGLRLTPSSTEPTFYFEGTAYLDMDIDCSLNAPKVTGNFKAAGAWSTP